METVENVTKDKLKKTIIRVFNNRSKWEPIKLDGSLQQLTQCADQLHYKLGREIKARKIKYYFLIHANDLEEGLLVDKEYFFTEGKVDVLISKFTYEDVYCVTYTKRIV